jgi:Sulfotransferase family
LHRLMCLDSELQSFPMWLGCNPMPRPPREAWAAHPAYQRTQQGLDWLRALSPRWFELHPQTAACADECRLIMDHSFHGVSLAVSAHVPEFQEWISHVDLRPQYRRHKRVLGLIAGGNTKRWFLKCPSYLWCLDAVLTVYPDACLVMTHRDPITSIPSLFGLVWTMRQHIEEGASPQRLGRECIGLWNWVMNKSERDRATIPESQIYDIHCDDVRCDPIGSLERIYGHFKLPITDEARAAWQAQISSDPRGGHNSQKVTPKNFALSAREIIDAMGPFYDRYRRIESTRRSAPANR